MQRWGEPRVTNDADLTRITGFGSQVRFIAALLKRFRARGDDAAELALQRRV